MVCTRWVVWEFQRSILVNKCCNSFGQVVFEDADYDELTPTEVNAALWIDRVPQLKRNNCLLHALHLNLLSQDTYNDLKLRMVDLYDTVDLTAETSADEDENEEAQKILDWSCIAIEPRTLQCTVVWNVQLFAPHLCVWCHLLEDIVVFWNVQFWSSVTYVRLCFIAIIHVLKIGFVFFEKN